MQKCTYLRVLYRGHTLRVSKPLFELPDYHLDDEEVDQFKQEAMFYLARKDMGDDNVEEAIKGFEKVNLPDASFYQAKVSKRRLFDHLLKNN